ncbi:hypothetical protein PENTCL1PPCAC_4393, partial [Pristionchus entomophagus]
TSQVECAVNQDFNGTNEGIKLLPSKIIASIGEETSISNLFKPNYSELSDNFSGSTDQVQYILDALNRWGAIGDDAAQKEVTNAIITYSGLLIAVSKKIPPAINELGEQVANLKQTIEATVNDNAEPIVKQATDEIDGMVDKVKEAMNGARSAIEGVETQVQKELDSMEKRKQDLNKNMDVTGWITVGLKVLIILPCVIALLAASVAFLSGSFLACKKKSIPSKGCCSTSCTLITLSIIIIMAIAFIVMIPATFAMTLGYGAQLVCQPFFYDEDLKALTAVDNVIQPFDVPTMNGSTIQLTFSEIMMSCEKGETFMNAVKGGDIIDLSMIEEAINPTTLAKSLNEKIEGVTIPLLDTDKLAEFKAGLDIVHDQMLPPLDKANAINSNIGPIITMMKDLDASLKPTIDQCKIIANSAQVFTNKETVLGMLKGKSTTFIFQLCGNLITAVKTFTSDLLTKSASCTPVFRAYEDVGNVVCEQMSGGVQGMWAAAGMTALFFVPTILALFCIAIALRRGKQKNHQRVNPNSNVF